MRGVSGEVEVWSEEQAWIRAPPPNSINSIGAGGHAPALAPAPRPRSPRLTQHATPALTIIIPHHLQMNDESGEWMSGGGGGCEVMA